MKLIKDMDKRHKEMKEQIEFLGTSVANLQVRTDVLQYGHSDLGSTIEFLVKLGLKKEKIDVYLQTLIHPEKSVDKLSLEVGKSSKTIYRWISEAKTALLSKPE